MSQLILITNDDGVQAKGIRTLARLMATLGEVYVVAPDSARSGASCSFTPTQPVRLCPLETEAGVHYYSCSGTPVDCVKLACEHALPAAPDLLVSGINHGDNASVNIHYSGTMGAVFEGCMKGIPSIGFSLRTFDPQADFSPYEDAIVKISRTILQQGLPIHTCLNVNFPEVSQLQGIRVTRMVRSQWSNEWIAVKDPAQKGLFKIAGDFTCLEPDATDGDIWALDHGFASVTPIHLDMTDYDCMEKLNNSFASSCLLGVNRS